MRNIFVKHSYFEFGSVVQEEMSSFKTVTYPKLCQLCCSAERNHLRYFGKAQYEKHFCKIILNFGQ